MRKKEGLQFTNFKEYYGADFYEDALSQQS